MPMVLLDLPLSAEYFVAVRRYGRAPAIVERAQDKAVVQSLVANGSGSRLPISAAQRSAPDGRGLRRADPRPGEPMRSGLMTTQGALASAKAAAFLAHCQALLPGIVAAGLSVASPDPTLSMTRAAAPRLARDPTFRQTTNHAIPDMTFCSDPVRIGPLTAKNRFFQVPHCNGGMILRRLPGCGVKAEGGWGVIFTEQTEMHPLRPRSRRLDAAAVGGSGHSCPAPHVGGDERAWLPSRDPACSFGDQRAEPVYQGGAAGWLSALPIRTFTNDPVQARALDKQDIRDLRRWFVTAAKRSRRRGST
ncbi:MAG: hypothetical protein R3D60_14245 [Paracoccaceae bacterium]